METLPREIIELIIHACEPKTLAISIPQVSKLFKNCCEDDGNVWKAKCEQKYSDLTCKPTEQTWKQFYFPDVLKLFPFHGFTVSKSTYEEILAMPNAVEKNQGGTIAYESHDFWIHEGVFDMLYLTTGDELPYEWIRQGISWDISFVEFKELLKKKVGNYNVIGGPYQNKFQGEDCFAATMTSAVKEDHGEYEIYYDLCLDFDFVPGLTLVMAGTEETPGTLYKIGIQVRDVDSLQYFYEARECID